MDNRAKGFLKIREDRKKKLLKSIKEDYSKKDITINSIYSIISKFMFENGLTRKKANEYFIELIEEGSIKLEET